ncbi:MAG: four helix bundle protein [Planctomycetaceae bacterium]
MTQQRNEKVFDLEERTYLFAKAVRAFVRRLPRTISNYEDVKQVVRSSGSVGANYIEANEGLGTKDFKMHAKICRKEAKESVYWLRLLFTNDNPELEAERTRLITEAEELKLIFNAIVRKAESAG